MPNEFDALGTQIVAWTTVVHVATRRVAQFFDVLVIVAVAVHTEQMVCFVEGDLAQELLTLASIAIQTENHRAEFEISCTPGNSIVEKRFVRDVDISMLLTTMTQITPALGKSCGEEPLLVNFIVNGGIYHLLHGARVRAVELEAKRQTDGLPNPLINCLDDQVNGLPRNCNVPENSDLTLNPPVGQVRLATDGGRSVTAHSFASDPLNVLAIPNRTKLSLGVPSHTDLLVEEPLETLESGAIGIV